MSAETWCAFAGAVLAMALIPGPSALLVASQAAAFGPRRALSALAGDLTACTLLVLLVGAGLGQVFAAFPWMTSSLRFAGVAYLILLALRYLAARASVIHDHGPAAAALFGQGFLTCIGNPKLLLHLAAFLPLFIDPLRPLPPQLLLVAATQVAIDGLVLGLYACAGGRMARANPQLVSRLAAVAMIAVAATLVIL